MYILYFGLMYDRDNVSTIARSWEDNNVFVFVRVS